MAARKKKTAEPVLKIIRTAKCQTISKKGTLTYNISQDGEGNIWIRIYGNSGGGFFSNEWILLDNITKLISGEEKPITSHILLELFKGKSVNSAAFLAAILLQEGMLLPCSNKRSYYVFASAEKLMKSIDK